MAKSNNKTNYEILSQKELKDKKIPFTAIPNELIELGVKYDSSHFFVMSYILMNSNSRNFKISKEGYLQRQANFEGGLRNGFIYTIYNNISKN